ncbi:S-layer homology domain-containing protein [Paenibacillus sp. S-38]|uniref:S-layer homology domain-containing protein n=1 Tax=Paenibacillus sp. S-38 TaxID=3416710 RepID=UPI003CEEFBBF
MALAPEQTQISVTVAESNSEAGCLLTSMGARVLTAPVTVRVEAVTKEGQKMTLEPNMTNTLVLPESAADVQTKHLAGVMIDPVTKRIYPVPTTFAVENGKHTAILPTHGNMIYMVIENEKEFSDVPEGHYAKESIDTLASKLIVTGDSSDSFAPNRSISRAEFAALLTRALGIVPQADSGASFSDVATDYVHAEAIQAAAKAGLINGYNDGTFKPNAQVSREEMAQMMFNAMKFSGRVQTDGISAAEKTQLFARFADNNQISDGQVTQPPLSSKRE